MWHGTVHFSDVANLQMALKICEDICSEIVETVVEELTQTTVTTCIDEIVKRYVRSIDQFLSGSGHIFAVVAAI